MGLIDSLPGYFLPRDTDGPLQTIDFQHSRIHSALSWVASYSVSTGTATAATMLITAPASGKYHVTTNVEMSLAGLWTLSEAPNASGGSAVQAYNCNRAASVASALVHTSAATYVSSGTILESHYVGSVATSGGGAPVSVRQEYILNPGSLYLVRVIASSASTIVNINLSYYKED